MTTQNRTILERPPLGEAGGAGRRAGDQPAETPFGPIERSKIMIVDDEDLRRHERLRSSGDERARGEELSDGGANVVFAGGSGEGCFDVGGGVAHGGEAVASGRAAQLMEESRSVVDVVRGDGSRDRPRPFGKHRGELGGDALEIFFAGGLFRRALRTRSITPEATSGAFRARSRSLAPPKTSSTKPRRAS